MRLDPVIDYFGLIYHDIDVVVACQEWEQLGTVVGDARALRRERRDIGQPRFALIQASEVNNWRSGFGQCGKRGLCILPRKQLDYAGGGQFMCQLLVGRDEQVDLCGQRQGCTLIFCREMINNQAYLECPATIRESSQCRCIYREIGQ
ncbi:hypothetical protein D3C78_1102700 [compost metagenome]